MKKFHIAIAVADINKSVSDYSLKLGCNPEIIIPNEYALWRTETLNFSIRKTIEIPGTVRHVGWEDSNALCFEKSTDVNGLVWEKFTVEQQVQEIQEAWPDFFRA